MGEKKSYLSSCSPQINLAMCDLVSVEQYNKYIQMHFLKMKKKNEYSQLNALYYISPPDVESVPLTVVYELWPLYLGHSSEEQLCFV